MKGQSPKPKAESPNQTMPTIQLDEQLRRYQDLAKRATDLRSYL
jgi:hypothetical protein